MNAIKIAVETGTYVMGVRQTVKAVREGTVKMVVVASGVNQRFGSVIEEARRKSVKTYEFPGGPWDLAALCSRGHMVSAIGIIDPGESDLLKRSE
ncbi:MAG: 50S ribosomal protein L30e [Thermoprotei archaeon]